LNKGFFAALLALPSLSIAAEPANRPVTFAKDVAPILQSRCEECHRKGTAAPMSLATFEETRPWAKSIKERVIRREMPPWHMDKTVGIQHFQNDRSLTDAQIETIVRWVDSGAPLGDPKDVPPAKTGATEETWQTAKLYGAPDFVVKTTDYTMPAHGQDVWWKPVTTLPLTEPRWVRAVEVRPGTLAGRRITHHARADLEQDDPEGRDAGDAGIRPAGILMEWAIGKQNDVYREGSGKLLVPGARIRWEMHLHAVGEEIRDHVELAVWLYPRGQEPKYKTVLAFLPGTPRVGGSQNIDIPPNSIAQTSGITVLRQAARLENYQPHMHLRGKAMLMEAILPDGTTETLSYVNNFNFNWMNNYIYADDAAPVLPKGTMLRVTAWYDNTKANPNNPDPNQWVGFGDRTVDEMSHAWLNISYISDDEYKEWAAKKKSSQSAYVRPGVNGGR
jgi:hypothetical protein